MAATKAAMSLWRRLLGLFGGLLGGLFAAGHARAVDLPEDKAEALIHSYSGGGVTAYGPAFLVRKSIFDKVSLSGTLLHGRGQQRVDRRRHDGEQVPRGAPRVRPERRLRLPRCADHALGA